MPRVEGTGGALPRIEGASASGGAAGGLGAVVSAGSAGMPSLSAAALLSVDDSRIGTALCDPRRLRETEAPTLSVLLLVACGLQSGPSRSAAGSRRAPAKKASRLNSSSPSSTSRFRLNALVPTDDHSGAAVKKEKEQEHEGAEHVSLCETKYMLAQSAHCER